MSDAFKEQGYECYDWYHYLWHLIAIGAVRRVGGDDAKYDIEPDAWADLGLPDGTLPGDGETIALIDTGVNDKHPNLPRIEDTVNFAVHPFGALYEPTPAPDPVAAPPGALAQVNVDTTMKRGLEDPDRSVPQGSQCSLLR